MNVKELREMLVDLPDNMMVAEHYVYAEEEDNVIEIIELPDTWIKVQEVNYCSDLDRIIPDDHIEWLDYPYEKRKVLVVG